MNNKFKIAPVDQLLYCILVPNDEEPLVDPVAQEVLRHPYPLKLELFDPIFQPAGQRKPELPF